MRWLGLVVLLGASAASARPFLGVQMQDMGPQGAGPCMIEAVTRGTGADLAGLHAGDVFVSIADASVGNCAELIKVIQSRDPGERVKIAVRRNGSDTSLEANLFPIDEILRRRYVGHPMPATAVMRVEDQAEDELGGVAGKTRIISWFAPGTCDGCTRVLDKVVSWQRAHPIKGAPISIVSATSDPNKSVPETAEGLKKLARTLGVPLFVTDYGTYDKFTIAQASRDRINFMVVDGRGIVRHVALIAPDSDEATAALDELYAAVEQAARRQR